MGSGFNSKDLFTSYAHTKWMLFDLCLVSSSVGIRNCVSSIHSVVAQLLANDLPEGHR